jgi:hypothetical protein
LTYPRVVDIFALPFCPQKGSCVFMVEAPPACERALCELNIEEVC